MKSEDVIIHIGFPKTATTFVQRKVFHHIKNINNIGKPYINNDYPELYKEIQSLIHEPSTTYNPSRLKQIINQLKNNGKKKSIIYVFIAGAIFMPISLLGLIDWTNTIYFAAVFVIGLAGVMCGWYLFPYIIYADLAEDDQRRTNVMKAGIYTGFPNIVLNLLQAFGLFILGLLFDYLPDVKVGTEDIPWAMIIWGPVCTFFLILAIIFTKKYVRLDFEWEKKE